MNMRGKYLSMLFGIIVFAIVFTLFPYNARGSDWTYFGSTKHGEHYFDKESIRKTETCVYVWERVILNNEGQKDAEQFLISAGKYNGDILYAKYYLHEFYCKNRWVRNHEMIFFDVNGQVVAQKRPEGVIPWLDVPNSLVEELCKEVCR